MVRRRKAPQTIRERMDTLITLRWRNGTSAEMVHQGQGRGITLSWAHAQLTRARVHAHDERLRPIVLDDHDRLCAPRRFGLQQEL
jgi:hypothetical protein